MNYEEYDAVNLPLSVRRCRMIKDGKRDIATKLCVAEQRGLEQGREQGLKQGWSRGFVVRGTVLLLSGGRFS